MEWLDDKKNHAICEACEIRGTRENLVYRHGDLMLHDECAYELNISESEME